MCAVSSCTHLLLMYAAVRSSGSSVEGTHNNAEERIYHSYRAVYRSTRTYINEGLLAQQAGRKEAARGRRADKMGKYKNAPEQTFFL